MNLCAIGSDCRWTYGLPSAVLFIGFLLGLKFGLWLAIFDRLTYRWRQQKEEDALVEDIKAHGIKHPKCPPTQ